MKKLKKLMNNPLINVIITSAIIFGLHIVINPMLGLEMNVNHAFFNAIFVSISLLGLQKLRLVLTEKYKIRKFGGDGRI